MTPGIRRGTQNSDNHRSRKKLGTEELKPERTGEPPARVPSFAQDLEHSPKPL